MVQVMAMVALLIPDTSFGRGHCLQVNVVENLLKCVGRML